MPQALAAHQIRPDVIAGAFVGAIDGACFAGDATPAGVDALAEVCATSRR